MDLEVVKLALSAGALGMNFLILWMLYSLANRYLGPAIEAVHTASLAFGQLKSKIDSLTNDTKRGPRSERADTKDKAA